MICCSWWGFFGRPWWHSGQIYGKTEIQQVSRLWSLLKGIFMLVHVVDISMNFQHDLLTENARVLLYWNILDQLFSFTWHSSVIILPKYFLTISLWMMMLATNSRNGVILSDPHQAKLYKMTPGYVQPARLFKESPSSPHSNTPHMKCHP